MFVPPKVSLLYLGLLSLMYTGLLVYVIFWRFRERRSLGFKDDHHSGLFRAVRAHGNFMEYAPILSILLALDEITGRSSMGTHLFGSMIVLGRVLHVIGVTVTWKPNVYRASGVLFTMLALVGLGLLLIQKGLA